MVTYETTKFPWYQVVLPKQFPASTPNRVTPIDAVLMLGLVGHRNLGPFDLCHKICALGRHLVQI